MDDCTKEFQDIALVLKFIDLYMDRHTDSVVPADEAQLERIGKLFEIGDRVCRRKIKKD